MNENLSASSHCDDDDEDVWSLNTIHHLRGAQEEKEGGTRGEDWEEVRFLEHRIVKPRAEVLRCVLGRSFLCVHLVCRDSGQQPGLLGLLLR